MGAGDDPTSCTLPDITIRDAAGTLTTTTDSTGAYQLLVHPGWSGVLRASEPDYCFAPAQVNYSDVQADQPGQDFTLALHLAIDPASARGGEVVVGTVTLPAPPAGSSAVVELDSDGPLVSVPESVTVPEGQTQATFNIMLGFAPARSDVPVTASCRGLQVAANVTVLPAATDGLYGANLSAGPISGDGDSHYLSESGVAADAPSYPGSQSLHWSITIADSNYTYHNAVFAIEHVYLQIDRSDPLILTYDGPVKFNYTTGQPDPNATTMAGQWTGTLKNGGYNGHQIRTWAWSSDQWMYFDRISASVPAVSPGVPRQPQGVYGATAYPPLQLDYTKQYPIIHVLSTLGPGATNPLPNGILQFKTVDLTNGKLWHELPRITCPPGATYSHHNVQWDYIGAVTPGPAGQGNIQVWPGPCPPADTTVNVDDPCQVSQNSVSARLMQFVVNAPLETMWLDSLTFTASGSGNDLADVEQLTLYRDNNWNGQIDQGDSPCGSAIFNADNGTATFDGGKMLVGQPICYLLEERVKGGAAQTSVYSVSLTSGQATHMWVGSEPALVEGLPISGATLTINMPPPIPQMTIAEAKQMPVGSRVIMTGCILSATFISDWSIGGLAYMQSADRSCGIAINVPGGVGPVPLGLTFDMGVIITRPGLELVAELSCGGSDPSMSEAPEPLYLSNAAVGGGDFGSQCGVISGDGARAAGINTIGLYSRIAGAVTHADGNAFWVDDGSGVWDGTMNGDSKVLGVKVEPFGFVPPAEGAVVGLTGVSSCYPGAEGPARMFRANAITTYVSGQ